jgi:protein-histidine N-methyltransferase
MAQPFSFGFSGDDIEVDENDAKVPTTQIKSTTSASIPEYAKAHSHRVEELVSATVFFISFHI